MSPLLLALLQLTAGLALAAGLALVCHVLLGGHAAGMARIRRAEARALRAANGRRRG